MSETKLDIKAGDRVRLKPFRVVGIDSDGDVHFEAVNGALACASPDLIESVEPRPLEAGDCVTRHGWDGKWSIVAINGGDAWIVSQDVSHAIARLSHLTRVDQ